MLQPKDAFFTLGAGNIYQIHKPVIDALKGTVA
jgi:UDP-N-acetylmuramate-alanine ligase